MVAAVVLPTLRQVWTAVHDTPNRLAAVADTVWSAQVAPPLSVVKMRARPLRIPTTVAEVVPTTAQRTPASPAPAGAGTVLVVVDVGAGTVVEVDGADPTAVTPVVVGAGATVVVGRAPA